ncbi:MAG TPA: Bax inhibitor-1/YccA family protein [Terriglobales bacterium]|nr:Bax inhibitor-1/YccA family protein [Terriglobales bacterium]
MALMRTSNPALNDKSFREAGVAFGQEAMTISGTVNKTGILLLCTIATAAWTWTRFMQAESAQAVAPAAVIGAIGGFIVAIVTVFKKNWAPITAPLYALLEGLVLGAISAIFEVRWPGLPIQAVSLTFGVLIVLLLAYRSGLIPVTDNLRLGIVAATGGVALFYLAQFVLGFFGIHFTSINSSSPIGIGFSVVVVIIASLNLVLDFDFIERGARAGAPKYMEWYGAFGLMVTLIWLYLEMLRLLAKIRDRR